MQNRWQKLKHYDIRDVLLAIRDHERNNPDAAKPIWGDIYARLHARCGSTSGLNDFEHLLEYIVRGGLNRHAKAHPELWKGWKRPDDYTREDLWLNYLSAQTDGIQRMMWGKLYPDEDGRRARLVQEMRRNEAARWVRYYKEIGQPAPGWLIN